MQLLKPLILILCLQLFFIQHGTSQSCYELVWSDEFNYSGAPDPTKWTHEVNGDGGGNKELQYYTDRLVNSRVEDSVLVIEAHKEFYENKEYTSARLITYDNNLSWQYGKMEARIKLPKGQGLWPAFWMLGDNIFEGTSWPACGEIDIMEMIGGGEGRDDTAHGTIHYRNNNGDHAQNGQSTQLTTGIFNDDFHVFSVEWDDRLIRWFLDGKPYYGVNITSTELTEFHEKFFLLLNVAVGGEWPGSPNASTQFPQQMLVDYVRVYQKDGTPTITGTPKVVKGQSNVEFSVFELDGYTYNWSVPEGAEIVRGQGTSKLVVNWVCAADTVKCELVTDCNTYHLVYPVGLKPMQMEGKTLVSGYESGLIFKVPATKNTSYQWSFPEDVMVPEMVHTNEISVDWGITSGTVKVKTFGPCGMDSAEISVISVLQGPYEGTVNMIPGNIKSVHFDTGGEGIAYHDTDIGNNGPGIRQDEDVDSEPGDGTGNIGWTEPGEWLEYTIKVEEAGTYDLQCRTAALASGGKFRILMNGVDKTGDKDALNENSWTTYRSLYIRNIELAVTDTIMRLEIINGDFNMANMNFTKATGTPVDEVKKASKLSIYPTLVGNQIYINGLESENTFDIVSVSGTKVKSGLLHTNSSIEVGDLKSGVYILMIHNKQESTSIKFIKID